MNIRIRFTIARKLAIGFGVLLVAVIFTSFFTYDTLQRNMKKNKQINEVYNPSATELNNLYSLIAESKMLIKNWAYIEKLDNTPDKKKLIRTHSEGYPSLNQKIQTYKGEWSKADQNAYENITLSIDTLFDSHKKIMSTLSSFNSYSNTMLVFEIYREVENGGSITVLTDRILEELGELRDNQEEDAKAQSNDMEQSFARFQRQTVWFGFVLVISVIVIAIWVTNTLVGPIDSIKRIIEKMGKGILPEKRLKIRADEIGDMASALNSLVAGLKDTSRFALEIGDGNFASEFNPLGNNDVLGNALLVMRDNLRRATDEEERRKEENMQRSWTAQGLAKFGEMLRENSEDIEGLASVIISNLVKYLEANQGGLFVLNDENQDDPYIELIAFYAYSRKKYLQKKIMVGENLVGQCVQEGETIYMTDLPRGYIEITSGLGKEVPRSLMIVPLKLNEEIYGVVEIASFNEFKPYEIEFVEKIGETIASTIQRVKITIQTNQLLEESRKKSEMLAQRELQAKEITEKGKTGEVVVADGVELKEKIAGFENKILEMYEELEFQRVALLEKTTEITQNETSLNTTLGKMRLSMKGVIESVNDFVLANVGYSEEMLTGKFLSDYLADDTIAAIEYQEIWPALAQGHIQSRLDRYIFDEKKFWFKVTFTPIKDENDAFISIIALFEDLTELVDKQAQLEKKLEKAELSLSKMKSE